MPQNHELSHLIDDARAGRLNRRDVFLRGLGLGLTTAASLALSRAVPQSASARSGSESDSGAVISWPPPASLDCIHGAVWSEDVTP